MTTYRERYNRQMKAAYGQSLANNYCCGECSRRVPDWHRDECPYCGSKAVVKIIRVKGEEK